MEHTPPYIKLEKDEVITDHFDPELEIIFPDVAKYESFEYKGENYIRFQGSSRTVSVKAKDIQEFLEKYKK